MKKNELKYLYVFVIMFFSFFLFSCDKTSTTTTSSNVTTSLNTDLNWIRSLENTVYLEVKDTSFNPLDYIYFASEDDTISVDDVIMSGTVDVNKTGEYTVTYKLVIFGQLLSTSVSFIVRDTVLPTIVFSNVEEGYIFIEGETIDFKSVILQVYDNYKPLTFEDIVITEQVDVQTPGSYTVNYRITDKAGNYKDYSKVFQVVALSPTLLVQGFGTTAIIDYISLANGDDFFVARVNGIVKVLVFDGEDLVYQMYTDSEIFEEYRVDYFDETHVIISEYTSMYETIYSTVWVYDTNTHLKEFMFIGSVIKVTTDEARYSERESSYFVLKDGFKLYQLNADFSYTLVYEGSGGLSVWSAYLLQMEGTTSNDFVKFDFYDFDSRKTSVVVDSSTSTVICSYENLSGITPVLTRWNDFVLSVELAPTGSSNIGLFKIYDRLGNEVFRSEGLSMSPRSNSSGLQLYRVTETGFDILTLDQSANLVHTYSSTVALYDVDYDESGNAYVYFPELHKADIIDTAGNVDSIVMNSYSEVKTFYGNDMYVLYDEVVYTIFDHGVMFTYESSVSYSQIYKVETTNGAAYVLTSSVVEGKVQLALIQKETETVVTIEVDAYLNFNLADSELYHVLFISTNGDETNIYYINLDSLTLQQASVAYDLSNYDFPELHVDDQNVVIVSNQGIYVAPRSDFSQSILNEKFERDVDYFKLIVDIGGDKDLLFIHDAVYDTSKTYYGMIEDGLEGMIETNIFDSSFKHLIIQGAEEGPLIYLYNENYHLSFNLSSDFSDSIHSVLYNDTFVMYSEPGNNLVRVLVESYDGYHFIGISK